jgi:hypothetical protein
MGTTNPEAPTKVLVVRTADPERRSHGGFQWPETGPVTCPDWDARPVCGGGLHGLLWGEGDGSYLSWAEEALWQIVEVDASTIVDIDGKVKFPAGDVLFTGPRKEALDFFDANGGAERAAVGAMRTAGYAGTATAGDAGTATAGNRGTATAGYAGTATAGDAGTATAGNRGTATAGYAGTATAGYAGTATAGYRGTATAGNRGTATAGYAGTATAGDAGTATAGNRGTATAGYAGTATAGDDGTLIIRWYDASARRYRTSMTEVGVDGIEANVVYKLDEVGRFIKAAS